MKLLPVPAPGHGVHQDILAGHEGKLLHKVLFHDLGINFPVPDHVDDQRQNGVHAQKRLRDGDAPVGGVVQRPFQPLGGGGVAGVFGVIEDVPG